MPGTEGGGGITEGSWNEIGERGSLQKIATTYPIHLHALPCGPGQLKIEQGWSFTSASSMAFCGSVILGNAYIAPATSLHLTFSSELRISVVNFAFFL